MLESVETFTKAVTSILPLDLDKAVLGGIVAAFPVLWTIWSWRKSELRADDVLSWGNEVIGSLQTLYLVFLLKPPLLDEREAKAKITRIIFETSILIERGRLFFGNQIIDGHGSHKEPAYRGYRPIVLDQLVIAHELAKHWQQAPDRDHESMRLLAERCLKKFVSLLQKEVGRKRTASADTKLGGAGVNLRRLLTQLEDENFKRRND